MEIERLREDNDRLSNVIQDIEDKADLYKEEKNKLNDKLINAQKEIKNYKALSENVKTPTEDSSTVKKMEEKLNKVENLLSTNKEESNQNQEKLKMELMSTKEKVKQVEAQLQLAELVGLHFRDMLSHVK